MASKRIQKMITFTCEALRGRRITLAQLESEHKAEVARFAEIAKLWTEDPKKARVAEEEMCEYLRKKYKRLDEDEAIADKTTFVGTIGLAVIFTGGFGQFMFRG